jgi:hypothetical protein
LLPLALLLLLGQLFVQPANILAKVPVKALFQLVELLLMLGDQLVLLLLRGLQDVVVAFLGRKHSRFHVIVDF